MASRLACLDFKQIICSVAAALSTVTMAITLILLLPVIGALTVLIGEVCVLAGVLLCLRRLLLLSMAVITLLHVHVLHATHLFGVVSVALEGGSSGDVVAVVSTIGLRSGRRHHRL